jgi:hypothetical protein
MFRTEVAEKSGTHIYAQCTSSVGLTALEIINERMRTHQICFNMRTFPSSLNGCIVSVNLE